MISDDYKNQILLVMISDGYILYIIINNNI